jgi:hypothetical protein
MERRPGKLLEKGGSDVCDDSITSDACRRNAYRAMTA